MYWNARLKCAAAFLWFRWSRYARACAVCSAALVCADAISLQFLFRFIVDPTFFLRPATRWLVEHRFGASAIARQQGEMSAPVVAVGLVDGRATAAS
jgi:hypothetical protein